MFIRRVLSFIFILTLLSGFIGSPQSPALASDSDPTALVSVPLADDTALTRFEATSLPAYARLDGSQGTYLLAGADRAGQQALDAAGLPYTLLDADLSGASYYLAAQMSGQPRPDWSAYGILLFDHGSQALLRTSTAQAERLSLAGAELTAITLDPKPLHPAQAQADFPDVIEPDPVVQVVIDQVDQDQVSYYDRQMAGEIPVWVDGDWYTLYTRYTWSGEPIQKATHWVGQHMQDLGLDVEYHVWDDETNPNVIGQITGLSNPDDIFIIGGHLDTVQGAPGADDNGSGSTATLLAADILSQFQWDCTLRFALWTGEEQGMLGSYQYAQQAYENGENILGYLNLDMLAWNTIGSDPDINLIYSSSMPETHDMALLFADVIDAYDLNLIPTFGTGISGSDHSSFWQFGYNAILGIEDDLGDDFNPYYHSPQDTPEHTDLEYFTNFTKAALATFVHMSGCMISSVGQLDGTVTAEASGDPVEGAAVAASNAGGQDFSMLTDASGYYTRTLPTDIYTLTVSAYSYLTQTITGLEVITDELTTQDFALQSSPVYTVSGFITEAGSGAPLDASLEFIGSPVTAQTDPATGFYQAELPQGHYTMKVRSPLHRSQERYIMVDQDQSQDFSLEVLPCILVVDDDQNNPNVRGYYTAALNALGAGYEVWDTNTNGDPTPEDLEGYGNLIWFTGGAGSFAFSDQDTASASAYLDAGGKLFLSAQNYLSGATPSDFAQDYLHVGSFQTNVDHHTVTGKNVYADLGPYYLAYFFPNNSDKVSPDGQAVLAFSGDMGNAGISFDGETFQTVFLGFPFEVAPESGRQAIMQRTLEFFGTCQSAPVNPDFTWSPLEPFAGEELTFQAEAQGFKPLTYTWDFGDELPLSYRLGDVVTHTYTEAGAYTVTLTASNPYGEASIQHVVAVSPHSPQIELAPQAISAALTSGESSLETLIVTNTGDLSLTFTLTDTGAASWLSIDPTSGVLEADQSVPIHLTLDATDLSEGIYTTTLQVESNDPQQPLLTVPVTLTVCESPGGLDFTWEPLTPWVNDVVTFTASASGTQPLTFTWDFGDGGALSMVQGDVITHTYTQAGTYTVTLTVVNGCGVETISYLITVKTSWSVFLPVVSKNQ
jgi:PKD repeat protein